MTRKLSIVRFKPKPEHFSEFVENLRARNALHHHEHDYRIMTTGDEVYGIVTRGSETLQASAERGVEWLNSQRDLLQEYDPVNRHTLPVTGDLVE